MSTQDSTLSLVGDIGGTNARFGLVNPGSVRPHAIGQYVCDDFPSLEDAIQCYLSEQEVSAIGQAAIAVATPVTGDTLSMTNNHWSFSRSALQRRLGFSGLQFINDFSVQALAIPHLRASDFRRVGGGRVERDKPLAVIGPGTGLGISGLVPTGLKSPAAIALEGEGGHVTLAARSAREYQVMEHLRKTLGHVSCERLLSGPGLTLINNALCEIDGLQAPATKPSDVTRAALAGSDEHCVETLNMFCSQLGSVAGDLALVLGAKGGVFICGGIVPRLGEYFDQSGFREAFETKGRLSGFLEEIATSVVTADNPALIGAATLTVES